jgi:hypothetical protein
MPRAVPYDELVRFAVAHDRINVLLDKFEDLDKRLGVWIGEQLGYADLPGEYADHVLEEFNAAVDERIASGLDA